MDGRLSNKAIFDWLGVRPHDADFELVACDRCGRQVLADHEHLRVFIDPADPRAIARNIDSEPWPACRGCGAADWDFVRAQEVALDWRWATCCE